MITNIQTGPLLVVISGPSGVGKDAVIVRMKELKRPFHYVVTATSRPKRLTEVDGRHYHFHSRAEFEKMIAGDRLMEWAVVYGNYYGVPRQEIEQALRAGKDTILKVDIQGAKTIKQKMPDAVFIFIMPASRDELRRRLKGRNSESETDLACRLAEVEKEVDSLTLFDYVVVNQEGKLDAAIEKIDAIVCAERCRVHPRVIRL